MIIYKNTAREV